MGMCDRLTQRALRSYFAELKLLPIPPGTIRRLLYYILANITIRLIREKWQDYIPPNPDESETGFLGAANRQGGTRRRNGCALAAVP
jgi:hypothetical protein